MSGVLNNTYNTVTYSLQQHTATLASLQEQVSTGSRINRASDDPTGAYRILELNTQERSLSNYVTNIQEASNLMQTATTAIDSMSEYFWKTPL